jgi:hypothetical protein
MTRLVFAVSFVITSIMLAVLAVKIPLKSNIAACCASAVVLVAGTVIINGFSGGRRRLLQFFLVISVLNLIIVMPEAILRLTGFRHESGIQFGYPRPYQFAVFEPHEMLFWRFPPSEPEINSYGFRSPEVTKPKPENSFRILFLGNSCTYQGHPSKVEEILQDDNPAIECLNFATPGYTTHQGRIIVESWLGEISPDLLVVSFGWNDRWLAYGSVDAEKQVPVSKSRTTAIVGRVYAKWRLLQFFRKIFSPVLGGNELLDVQRVPPDQFRLNLTEIGRVCSDRGIPVIFATEPSSHASHGVPDYVVESKYALSKESSLELLRHYNDIVREVVREHGDWHLVDLDTLISSRNDVRDMFTGDGLHYSDRGLDHIADIESRFIKEHFLRD